MRSFTLSNMGEPLEESCTGKEASECCKERWKKYISMGILKEG